VAGEVPDVQYELAAGTPDQLQQGAASELNAGLPTENPQAPEAAVEAPAEAAPELAPAEAADHEPIFEPTTDDEAFITGPTTRPDEGQFVGAMDTQTKLTPVIRKQLPALQRAAAEPGSSQELQNLVAFLLKQA
jgi:hypothetical protein